MKNSSTAELQHTREVRASLESTVVLLVLPGSEPAMRVRASPAARAVLHGGMDVLTLGLWEVVGTPLEAVQGQKFEMTVTYGPDGKAKAIESRHLKSGL